MATQPTAAGSRSTIGPIEVNVKGQWISVPALQVDGTAIVVRGRWLRKAIVEGEEWLERELADPALCVSELKAHRSRLPADVFSFVQKIPCTSPKYSYPMEWHSVAAVRVTTFKEWWDGLPQETRKNVRRSQKRGVVVTIRELDDRLIHGIIDVNNDSPLRQNVPFTHFGKPFDEVKKDQSSFAGRSDFVCAHVGEELIGFIKIVYRGEVASILQILPRATHYDKRPANALLARAVELCAEKGISYLTYGMFKYGNKSESSLLEFKVRNGFEELLVPRYYVPLTPRGALALKLNAHRGLLGILPPRAIAIALKARAMWHGLRRDAGRCSSTSEQSISTRQMGRSNPPAGSTP